MQRIFFADSAILRDGLVQLLVDRGFTVTGAVGDPTALRSSVAQNPPDVAVIDIRMPPTYTHEGARAAVELRGTRPDLGILLLSQSLESRYITDLVQAHPQRFGYLLKDRVMDATVQAVAALGLKDGPIHAELRLNDQGPWVIEVGARSIGGLCARALRFGAGISLEELILSHVLGLPIETMAREDKATGVMMIPIPQAGVLESVGGLEAARRVSGVSTSRF